MIAEEITLWRFLGQDFMMPYWVFLVLMFFVGMGLSVVTNWFKN